ncbi:unnamed protein product [Moneuplotes crassus]|uniref:Uncharacterized protein n=1 Tax=Euplotes crassus TaxID=5936 RepID=A0AAD1Y5B3_EUPCR|nr:unnamed protein product [Moneuplotes crassus]
MEYDKCNPYCEDIKLRKILVDVNPNKIKKIVCHPELPLMLVWDAKSTVTLWETDGHYRCLNTFTPYTLLEDSDGIKVPPLGISLKSVAFADEHTIKWSSVSQMGFTMIEEESSLDQDHSLIIFVFELFIIFHDYRTKKNRYLQKADIESKGFASCIGVSKDFVAIGNTDGWITMFKISEWSVGRLLSKGYHTKAVVQLDVLIRYKKAYVVSGGNDGLCAVWAPFSSVGTPMIKYKGFKGESFASLQINRLQETVLCMGSNNTVGIWNIKDGSELFKIRNIKTRTKSTIIDTMLWLNPINTATTISGIAKDSTLELIETNTQARVVSNKGKKKANAVYVRTLFDLNSFLKSPIKGLKFVSCANMRSRPYTTILASHKEIYILDVKKKAIPSGCVLHQRIEPNKMYIEYLLNKDNRINHYELELDIEDSKVINNRMNFKGSLDTSYQADLLLKISPCKRFYSVEYIYNGIFEIYVNPSYRSRTTTRKILTGAGYNLVWSSNNKMFAVISFLNSSMEAFEINADALNHPIAKQKLEKDNIKSSVVIYKIDSDKPRKVFVFQKVQCYHLYTSGPVLGMCINYEMPKDDEAKNSQIIEANKALLFLSWDTQKPVTSPMEPPEDMVWSKNSKFCAMSYMDSICVYSVKDGLELENKYNLRSKHLSFITYSNLDILFIVTDTEIYASIAGSPKASLHLIAKYDKSKVELEGEESKEDPSKANIEPALSLLTHQYCKFSIGILSLVKNTLVLQTHSSEIKCLEITNLEFKKILQNGENRDSTLPFSLASEGKSFFQ